MDRGEQQHCGPLGSCCNCWVPKSSLSSRGDNGSSSRHQVDAGILNPSPAASVVYFSSVSCCGDGGWVKLSRSLFS